MARRVAARPRCARVRALDGGCETHVLYFPDADAFANFQADPVRRLAREDWDRCGAAALAVEVEAVETVV